jgi:hypothetical protein
LPFWDGPQTLGVLRESTAKTVQTPIAALLVMLNADRQSVLEVPAPFRLGFTAAFLACAACILFASSRSPDAGLRTAVLAALAIFVAYLYLGLWWFWPQYITWLHPLAAVLRSRVALPLTILFSATAMTVVMFHGWWWTLVGPDQAGYNLAVAAVVFVPPALYLVVHAVVDLFRKRRLTSLPRAA